MTDRWEFFPCTMGDDQAFIFTDVGIKDQLSEVAPENLFKVRLDYKVPDDNGLPTEQEFEPAKAIEDELQEYVDGRGDFYVGRITVSGQRHFFVYVQNWEGYEKRVAEIGRDHGYDLKCAAIQDSGHSQYWDYLWPSDSDWQIIHDMRALEALKNDGDDHGVERDVDHWIDFDDSGAAAQYRDWAVGFGFEEVRPIELVKGRFSVRLKHHGRMLLGDISGMTIPLALKAKEMGGDYDGWETPVMRSSQQDDQAGDTPPERQST
jgi:hypothetical protein